MRQVNIGMIVQDIISRVHRNRTESNAPIFLSFLPTPPPVPWPDYRLEEFLRYFLYETLISNCRKISVEISLRQPSIVKDLNTLVHIQPSYWVQLSISGRGLGVRVETIGDLFAEVGYRCEERLGSDSTNQQLGIFESFDAPRQSLIFYCSSVRERQRLDLLVPIIDKTRPAQLMAVPQ